MQQNPLRTSDIRMSNEKLVLNLIFRSENISQSEVVQRTGLKAPTVFRIFTKLEQSGFIQRCDENTRAARSISKSERKGRKPSYFRMQPNSAYAVGVDFSRTAGAVTVVDFSNSVIHHDSVEFTSAPNRDVILDAVDRLIRRALQLNGIKLDRIIGIGLASPGVIDTASGRVLEYRRISGLSGFSLKKHFESTFRVPVHVHNNASVIAASAYHYGVARGESSLLAVLVRSGVGGALVTDGRIFLNGTRTAIEVGRTAIRCESFEDLVSTRAALENFVAEGPLLSRLHEQYNIDSWPEADEKLTRGEAASALSRELRYFTIAVHNLNHVFRPGAILVIARYRLLAEVLADAVRRGVPQRRVIAMVYDPVQACYGATDIVFHEFFRASGDRANGA